MVFLRECPANRGASFSKPILRTSSNGRTSSDAWVVALILILNSSAILLRYDLYAIDHRSHIRRSLSDEVYAENVVGDRNRKRLVNGLAQTAGCDHWIETADHRAAVDL